MTRGFPTSEYRARVAKAQAKMDENGLAALLLTTEPDVRYFSGFLTRFWESPTRPWFLIVPASGDPIAVIPAIGAPLMERGWIRDIRTWRAPDLQDDGVSLLIDTLQDIGGHGAIGIPAGHETHVRMPQKDFDQIKAVVDISSDHGIMRELRMIKSDLEVEKIRRACDIAGRAFDRVQEIARQGTPLDEVFRRFQMLCLEEGADWVPYLAGAAGPNGYHDVISPATTTPLASGDTLMLDTGLVYDGYFCDFDRNFSVGPATAEASAAHTTLMEAVEAAIKIARPGKTAADIFAVMDKVLTGGNGGSEAGRYGHGLGMQLTEWPSLIPSDETRLEAGMVLTIEPSIETIGGRLMVHEENIVIRDNGCEALSSVASSELEVI